MMIVFPGFVPGSISSLVVLFSGLKSCTGIVLTEPAPHACFGPARSGDPLAFDISKEELVS